MTTDSRPTTKVLDRLPHRRCPRYRVGSRMNRSVLHKLVRGLLRRPHPFRIFAPTMRLTFQRPENFVFESSRANTGKKVKSGAGADRCSAAARIDFLLAGEDIAVRRRGPEGTGFCLRRVPGQILFLTEIVDLNGIPAESLRLLHQAFFVRGDDPGFQSV